MEKQIEEMAKELQELANIVVQTDFDYRGLCWQKGVGKCPYEETMNCQACTTVKNILDAGYRKIDEGSVVLTREELKKLFDTNERDCEEMLIIERTETAKEILQKLESLYAYYGNEDAIFVGGLKDDFKEIAKEYGVEIDQ